MTQGTLLTRTDIKQKPIIAYLLLALLSLLSNINFKKEKCQAQIMTNKTNL